MKRGIAVSVALGIVGTTLAVAVPARAAESGIWALDCVEDIGLIPALQTAYLDSEGRLIVNPEGAPADASAYAQWAPGAALTFYQCVIAPIPLDSADCMVDKLLEIVNSVDPLSTHFRYVYPNPNGPGVAVDTPLLVADAMALVDCSITAVRP